MLLATGSSLNAALCARYFFEQRFGVLVDIKEPYNFTHYELSTRIPIWWWRFPRAEKARRRWRRCVKVQSSGLPVFALTSDPQSPTGRACDGVLDINTGIESVGFVTRGFSATVLNLLLIALMIARSRGRPVKPRSSTILPNSSAGGGDPEVIARTSRFIDRHSETLRRGDALSPPAMARWLAWRKSSKPNLPRRCGAFQRL